MTRKTASGRSGKSQTSAKLRKKQPPGLRLNLEMLEDRTLLTGGLAGSLDPTFGVGGQVITDWGGSVSEQAAAVAFPAPGIILVAGSSTAGGAQDFALAEYNADGSLHTEFGVNGKVTTDFAGTQDFALTMIVQPDGKILVGGRITNATQDFALARYNADGTLDSSFGNGGKVVTIGAGTTEQIGTLALQADGKILAGGFTAPTTNGNARDFRLVRYNTDGSLDATFGTGGTVITDLGGTRDQLISLIVQADGKIVAAGDARDTPQTFRTFNLVRYNTNGTIDTTFGTNGTGIVATSFGAGQFAAPLAATAQPDGKMILAGWITTSTDSGIFAIARYDVNGHLDTSFGSGGLYTQNVGTGLTGTDVLYSVTVQPDGKIVAAGQAVAGGQMMAVLRLNSNGTLDTAFGAGGLALTSFGGTSDGALAVGIQPDGNIVAVGGTGAGANPTNWGLARFIGNSTPIAHPGGGSLACIPAAGHYEINEGQSLNLDASLSSDPDGDSLTYAWDLDGDNQYDDATGVNPTITWSQLVGLGQRNGGLVSVRVTDSHGASNNSPYISLIVNDTNGSPTAHPGGGSLACLPFAGQYTINEGESLNLDGSLSSDPENDPLTYAWDLDHDGQYDDATGVAPQITWSQLVGLGLGHGGQVSVRVTDSYLNSNDSPYISLTVNDVPPTLTISGSSTVNEGSAYTLTLGASDPGGVTVNNWFIIWGDGQMSNVAGNLTSVTHVYTDGGAGGTLRTINALANTSSGMYSANSVQVTVNNVTPVVDVPESTVVQPGGTYSSSGSFSDPGTDTVWTATVNYGDGGNDVTLPLNGKTFQLSHQYGGSGTYTVTVKVTDKDGATGTTTRQVFVNAAPTAHPGGGSPASLPGDGQYTISEGQSLNLDGSLSSDPENDPLTYAWDLDYDGQYDDATGVNPSIGWSQLVGLGLGGGGLVGVRVTDSYGNANNSPYISLIVNDTPPTLTISGNSTVNEGAAYILQLASSDPGNEAITGWSITWGDGQTQTVTGNPASVLHVYADGTVAGTQRNISAKATNADGTFDANGLTVTIKNVVPQPYLNPVPQFGPNGQLLSDVSLLLGRTDNANQPQTMAVQADGKFVAIGGATDAAGTSYTVLVRYTADGMVDGTFGTNGIVKLTNVPGATNSGGSLVKIDASGNILVAGSANFAATGNDLLIRRYTSAGVLDTAFGVGGYAYTDIGSILNNDPTKFSMDSVVGGLVVQPDGKLLLVGTTTPNGGTAQVGMARFNANGTLDLTFGNGKGVVSQAFAGFTGGAMTAGLQSDGKIIAGVGYGGFGAVRFNADGTLDNTFGTNGLVTVAAGAANLPTSFSLGIGLDDSVYLTGSASRTPHVDVINNDIVLIKLTRSGVLDTSFAVGSPQGAGKLFIDASGHQDAAYNVIVQADGKIVIGGYGKWINTSGLNQVAVRVNPDGTLDSSFGVNGMVILDYQGLDDGSNGSLGLLPNGDIVIGGYVAVPNTGNPALNHRVWGFTRLSTSNTTTILEGGTFIGNGVFADPGTDSAWTATVDYGDGGGAQALTLSGTHFNLNHTYADNGTYTVTVKVTDKDGGIGTVTRTVVATKVDPLLTIGGSGGAGAATTTVNEGAAFILNLSKSDPGADTITGWVINWGDGTTSTVGNVATAVHVYADGSAAGTVRQVSATATDEDGSYTSNTIDVTVKNVVPQPYINLDPGFGTNGQAMIDVSLLLGRTDSANQPQTMAIQADGKFIAIGSATDAANKSYTVLVRATADGQVDLTFGTGGVVKLAAPAGYTGFISGNVRVDAAGNILIIGTANGGANGNDIMVQRFTSAGVLDNTFGVNGIVTVDIGGRLTGDPTKFSADGMNAGLAFLADGKILLVGTSTPKGGASAEFGLVRLNANGTVDVTFGSNGVMSQGVPGKPGGAVAINLQSDGKIVAAMAGVGGITAVRFNANGALDNTFGTGGSTTIVPGAQVFATAFGVGISPTDDSIYLTGSASRNANTDLSNMDIVLVKLTKDGALDTNFAATSPYGAGKLFIDPSGHQDAAYNIVVQADGKVVIGGYGKWINTTGLNQVAIRVKPDGTLDNTFGKNGIEILDYQGLDDGSNGSLGLLPNGDIVIGGYVAVPNTANPALNHRVWGFTKLSATGAIPTILVGGTYNGTGVYADPGTDSNWTATVDYGDGAGDQPLGLSGSHFNLSHSYATAGTYTITVKVTDKDGAVGTATQQVLVNTPPVAHPGGGSLACLPAAGQYTINEGQSLNLDGSLSSDADGDSLTYAWDLDHDGQYDDATGVNPTITWSQLVGLGLGNGGQVGVRVTDSHGASNNSPYIALIVNDTPPTLTITGSATVNEGATYLLQLASSDPGNEAITSWTINWGDGGAAQIVTGNPASVLHVYADGSVAGTERTITAKATNSDGTFNANSITVTVKNVVPQPYVNLDPQFASNGQLYSDVSLLLGRINAANQPQTMAVQADGKFVAIGSASDANGNYTVLVRYTADGQVDGNFGTNGIVKVTTPPGATAFQSFNVKVDANGNILVAGSATFVATGADFMIQRFTTAGVLDNTFGVNGVATVDVGTRLTSDNTKASVESLYGGIVVQPDGKLLLVGTSTPKNGTAQIGLARFNANGTVDNTFGVNGVMSQSFAGFTSGAVEAGVQSDGKIIAAVNYGGFGVVRFNANGTLDATFGTNGITTVVAGPTNLMSSFSLGIAPDDSIYLTGSASRGINTDNSNNDIVLIKFTKNGALDTNFAATSPFGAGKLFINASGHQDAAYNVIVQPDGKVVIGGWGKWINTSAANMVAIRVNPDGTLDSTFGKDGMVVLDYQNLDDGSNGSLGLTPSGDIIIGGYVAVPNTGNPAANHRVWGFTKLLATGTVPTITAGGTYTGTGVFADPGTDSAWTATVDYNDGAGAEQLTLSGSHFNLSHSYATAGTYTITVKITDKDGGVGTVTQQVNVVAPAVPPQVTNIRVNDGSAQRSMVTSLTVSFNSVVTLDSNAIDVSMVGGGSAGLIVSQNDSSGYTVLTVTFTGVIGGSLADGRYNLTVHGDRVHGTAGQTMATDAIDHFFRFFGDLDGDADVDNLDYNAIRAAMLSPTSPNKAAFDYDGNGVLNATDLAAFMARRGKTLP